MSQYVLYKCVKEFVEEIRTMPKPVSDYLEHLGYVQDKETVKEDLEELVYEFGMSQKDADTIIAYLDKHELYEYDIDVEYE